MIYLRKKYRDFPGQITLEDYLETVRNAMAVSNMEWAKGLVRIFVRNLDSGIAYEKEELEGVALYGLAKAIREFDSTRVAFRTFASKVIHNELMRHLRTYSRKTLKTVAIDEIDEVPAKESFGSYEFVLDSMLGTAEDEDIKLGLYAMKMKNRGMKVKELEKKTGIPASRWYSCIRAAKQALKAQFSKLGVKG